MTSYQKLKMKCEHLQSQVDIFKNALTIIRTEPEMKVKPDGDVFLTSSYKIIENKIDYDTQVALNHWVAFNLDEITINRLLKMKKGEGYERCN